MGSKEYEVDPEFLERYADGPTTSAEAYNRFMKAYQGSKQKNKLTWDKLTGRSATEPLPLHYSWSSLPHSLTPSLPHSAWALPVVLTPLTWTLS